MTPDATTPASVVALGDLRVAWLNFLAVSQAIDELLGDPLELVSEQSRFLQREPQALFAQDGLLDPQEDVVIVAARHAYGTNLAHGAYICQPGRPFRTGVSRMAFYKDGAVQKEVPIIMARRDNVDLTLEHKGTPCQLFLLTPRDDSRTLALSVEILNTTVGASGKLVPFLQGQRCTRSDVLASNPATTDELEARGG